ncbi:putative tubulin polyglutamylase TTLL9 isoform X3 [Glandiceps talaboti]
MSKNTTRYPSYRTNERKRGIGDRVIRYKCALQNTISDVLRAKGWQEVREDGDFDFYWAEVGWMREYFDHCYLEEHVKINHFRNHYELTRKNLMVKNLKRYRKQLERENGKLEASKCDFFPTSFELPNDTYTRRDDKQEEREAPETYIVSRYVDNPYVIGGKKFDIRVYVLVTSYVPLKAWLYRSGFARFSNTRFSLDSIDDTYVHLTNVAIQKTAPDYDPERGCKWSMQQLRQYLIAKHGIDNVENMFRLMDDIFIRSLQSVQKVMINDKHCFELYGYDILIDEELKPWLIEVNASPSLTASNDEDYHLKFGLLEDVIHVLDLENKLTGKEKRIGGFDMMWNDGPVTVDEGGVDCITAPTYSTNTFLGCDNDRKRQLKQLMKQVQATRKQ